MNGKEVIKRFFSNFESYVCQFLLAFFVTLLFVQIILRELFGYTLSWGEELARFSFVWFVFLGAVVAAQLAAHNRVTFQFKIFPKKTRDYIQAFSDLIWLCFNLVMIYKSVFLIQSMMEFTYESPTLGWNMAYVYFIFPIAFTAMSIRIVQVNYLKLVKGVDIRDPDQVDMEQEYEKIAGSKQA
jgi:TRAP-type C4-dicarboxylate transport system permease small subunit